MPNWIYNNLNITGPEDEVREFHASVDVGEDDNGGFIRKFIPFPAELEGNVIIANGEPVGRAFTDEGYWWCVNNWGTKWGDCETEVVSEPHELSDGTWSASYRYSTAWSPADAAIVTIAKKFPNLTFDVSWEEEGHQSCGVLAVKGERYVVERPQENEYPDHPDDWNNDEAWDDFYERWTLLRDRANERAFQQLTDLIDA